MPKDLPFDASRPNTPKTVEQAIQLREGAAIKRARAQELVEAGCDAAARLELEDAESMETASAAFLQVSAHMTGPVRVGNGGEVAIASRVLSGSWGVIDTVRE